jgi:hypothetical protein
MSFELAQEVSSVFKGSSKPLTPIPDWFVDVDKKVESLTLLKSYLKRNDVDVS